METVITAFAHWENEYQAKAWASVIFKGGWTGDGE